jgi:superfamily II RNA helicase
MKEDTSLQKGKKKLNELLKRREDLISEMKKNPCWDCEHRSLYMTQQVYAKKLKDELDEIQKIIQGGTNEKEIEFNKRNEILTIYKIVDKDLNLLFKGKVAAKVTGADNILLTEFFFSGMINELSDVELLSVLSIFSCENRAKGDVPECSKVYSEKFTSTLNFI